MVEEAGCVQDVSARKNSSSTTPWRAPRVRAATSNLHACFPNGTLTRLLLSRLPAAFSPCLAPSAYLRLFLSGLCFQLFLRFWAQTHRNMLQCKLASRAQRVGSGPGEKDGERGAPVSRRPHHTPFSFALSLFFSFPSERYDSLSHQQHLPLSLMKTRTVPTLSAAPTLSTRGQKALARPPLLRCSLFECLYGSETAPLGLLNLGVAENVCLVAIVASFCLATPAQHSLLI